MDDFLKVIPSLADQLFSSGKGLSIFLPNMNDKFQVEYLKVLIWVGKQVYVNKEPELKEIKVNI